MTVDKTTQLICTMWTKRKNSVPAMVYFSRVVVKSRELSFDLFLSVHGRTW